MDALLQIIIENRYKTLLM